MSTETRKPRRVVTKIDADGLSRIARDEELAEMDYAVSGEFIEDFYPGWHQGVHPEIRVVWGTQNLPFRQPDEQDEPPSPTGEVRGSDRFVRMSHITYPPGWQGTPFWSETTDVIWVISGEFTVVTDGGDEVTLYPGDTLVQNATNKSLHNRGTVPCVIGTVMCATDRVGVSPPIERCANREETAEE
jgi:mannose-6-phosphate isomerase-like protein (cupin superfamily)